MRPTPSFLSMISWSVTFSMVFPDDVVFD